jgi:hypothetical protein
MQYLGDWMGLERTATYELKRDGVFVHLQYELGEDRNCFHGSDMEKMLKNANDDGNFELKGNDVVNVRNTVYDKIDKG